MNLSQKVIAQNPQTVRNRCVGLQLGSSCVSLDEDGGDREARNHRRATDHEKDPVVGSHPLNLRPNYPYNSPPMRSEPRAIRTVRRAEIGRPRRVGARSINAVAFIGHEHALHASSRTSLRSAPSITARAALGSQRQRRDYPRWVLSVDCRLARRPQNVSTDAVFRHSNTDSGRDLDDHPGGFD